MANFGVKSERPVNGRPTRRIGMLSASWTSHIFVLAVVTAGPK